MTIIDRITFPIAAYGPFLPVSASQIRPGTYQQAVDAGGLDRSGLTSPYCVKGVNLGEVFTGAAMEEIWEMGLQQVYEALTVILCSAVFCTILLTIPASPDTLKVLAALFSVITFGATVVVGDYQTAGSEEESHAIALLAAMQFDGVTEERARQQFVDNLPDYDYGALSGKSEAQLYAEVSLDRPYAQKWLARPSNQKRAAAFRKQVADQARDVQIAQQVAA